MELVACKWDPIKTILKFKGKKLENMPLRKQAKSTLDSFTP